MYVCLECIFVCTYVYMYVCMKRSSQQKSHSARQRPKRRTSTHTRTRARTSPRDNTHRTGQPFNRSVRSAPDMTLKGTLKKGTLMSRDYLPH